MAVSAAGSVPVAIPVRSSKFSAALARPS